MLRDKKKLMFLSYFRELPSNVDVGAQEQKVIELRQRLERDGVLYKTYSDPSTFRDLFTHDLYDTMLRFRLSTSKQKALRAFWQLGITDDQKNPRLAIIYPPLDRSLMKQERPDRVWLDRLVPNVVFEDFKAMRKVEKTLRIIGFSEIDTYSTLSYPPDIQDWNRLWICLPRNAPGMEQMNLYRDVKRFRFIPRKSQSEAHLYWRTNENTELKIKSPLSNYLRIQRSDNPGGPWRTEHERIIAKDYAVLARFTDASARKPTISGTLKDYFLAGIRGLGTWGAGWFLDRKYKGFLQYDENDPIQLLLEVTYLNGVIYDVQDVSGEPQSYFDLQNQVPEIRQVIAKLHPK